MGITRAKRRLFLSHAWRRATWGGGGMSIPSRFLMEIPAELMVGPQLRGGGGIGADLDPDLVFRERGSRLGAGIRAGGGAYRQGSGRPGAPAPGETFRPSRDLGAKRDAYAAGAPSGSLGRLGGGLGSRAGRGRDPGLGRRVRSRPRRSVGFAAAWVPGSGASSRRGRSSRANAATATATACATRAGATGS